MIRKRIGSGIRPYVLDIVLGVLSVGAYFALCSEIGEYLKGRYEFSEMVSGISEALLYGGTFTVLFLCVFGLPFVILVRLFWRCRKDGVRGMAIRVAIVAVIPTLIWSLAGSWPDAPEMRLEGFAARIRSQEADVAAIREWLETSRPPVENVKQEEYVVEKLDPSNYPDGLTPRTARFLEDGRVVYIYWPRPLRVLGPEDARILEDGCLELGWHQRDVGSWGVIIAPTEDFRQEEYKARMAAGAYMVVYGKGEPTQYKEYMVQVSPGVYAWLRPQPEPPDPFPSEGG